MEINKIYNENCVKTLMNMPDNFIDLVVTSPPYDELREYNGYEFNMQVVSTIAIELTRVIKVGGVVVWIVGDSVIDGSESGNSFRHALEFIDAGFKLHDTMIYQKNSASFPSNEKSKRYTQIFEYMFIFSMGEPKTVNLIQDKKNKWAGHSSFDGKVEKVKDFSPRENIWKYTTSFNDDTEHPAVFPEKLCADHIHSWSNEGDLIYDPFMGSGTTAKMAHLQNRNWIGSEISQEYVDLANKRIKPYINQTTLIL